MTQSNQPTHAVFFIKAIASTQSEDDKKKSIWTRIGAGWELDSGRINTLLEFTPTGEGTIQLVPVELLTEKI